MKIGFTFQGFFDEGNKFVDVKNRGNDQPGSTTEGDFCYALRAGVTNAPPSFVHRKHIMLKILIITFILVGIAILGLGIRLLLDRKAEFSGGSCQSGSEALEEKGITCGCGGHCVTERDA
jgi:hypothetical protein